MTNPRRLSIILPSYNDARIERAIRSIRAFDDAAIVKVVVVDGGSRPEILELIRKGLSPCDVLVSEPDRGIFDALNKGLDLCDTELVGWLGSDDLFTGNVLASRVAMHLEDADLLVARGALFRGEYITRVTPSAPSRLGLVKYGFNNHHFATFGTARLLKSERFSLALRGSDIEYFLKIFARKPRVVALPEIVTLGEEGGFSTRSRRNLLDTHLPLVPVYAGHTSLVSAWVATVAKLGYKLCQRVYFTVVRRRARDCSPLARDLL
jgi:glycosyltransferase